MLLIYIINARMNKHINDVYTIAAAKAGKPVSELIEEMCSRSFKDLD